MRIRMLSLFAVVAFSAAVLAQQPPGVQQQPPGVQMQQPPGMQIQQPPGVQKQPPGVQMQQPPGSQQFPPAPQVGLDPANNKLDAVLYNWEKALSGLKSLKTDVTRTAKDKVFMTTEIYKGVAQYLAPNKASLYLKNADPKKPNEFEMLVCNGQVAYKWEPSKKEIHIHELPAPKQGQINDDNFVSMLFGMKARCASAAMTCSLSRRRRETIGITTCWCCRATQSTGPSSRGCA